MNWNDGRIVRVEIKDGKATVTDVPKDVTVIIVNYDKQENFVDLGINSSPMVTMKIAKNRKGDV